MKLAAKSDVVVVRRPARYAGTARLGYQDLSKINPG